MVLVNGKYDCFKGLIQRDDDDDRDDDSYGLFSNPPKSKIF